MLNFNYDSDTVYNYEDYLPYEIGVCGYPGDDWYKTTFPQVQQFYKFKSIEEFKDRMKKAK